MRLEDANRYYTEDLQAGTLTAGGYQRRALTWRVLGKLDLAIEDFSASLQLTPGNFFNYEQRGELWKAKGDLDKSQADFAESVRLKSEKR